MLLGLSLTSESGLSLLQMTVLLFAQITLLYASIINEHRKDLSKIKWISFLSEF